MASKKMTEYERQRLENIRRNEEMLAKLNIQSKISQLSALTKQKKEEEKSYKRSSKKRSAPDTPTEIRRSLRRQGLPPDASTAKGIENDTPAVKNLKMGDFKESPSRTGPISMSEAYSGEHSDRPLTERLLGLPKRGIDQCMKSLDLETMSLEPENVARVLPGKILALSFFPSCDGPMIAAGNKFGELAFWDIDAGNEEGDGIYLYKPFSSPVSGIVFNPHTPSKVYTSCYDGLVRVMDAEKEVFGLLYSNDDGIYSLSQRPDSDNSVSFGDTSGTVKVFDERNGKCSASWILHEAKINSIDYNQVNPLLMATGSTDGTACIWDLRKIAKDKPESLKVVKHKRSVQSAYFSPSGNCLVTTSLSDHIGIMMGKNYEEEHMIYHYNQTGRWLSTFKGIWGWDDSYVFIGNMSRGVDVVSTTSKRLVTTLTSDNMTAIPCRFAKHPTEVGTLAGATSGGQIYLWKSSS